MGFFWSKPSSFLTEPLLPLEPEMLLKTGDLLLIPAADTEVVMNGNLWVNVGLVVGNCVYMDGRVKPMRELVLSVLSEIWVRQLDCVRPIGFEKKMFDVVQYQLKQNCTACEDIGYVLMKMGLIETWRNTRPCHFSSESSRLDLHMYLENRQR